MGAMAALAVGVGLSPTSIGASGYVVLIEAMAKIAAWVILPSMALTVVAGLLAIAMNPAFHDAGWAWVKAATGIVVFEGAFQVVGPIQDEAAREGQALVGSLDPASVARLFASERGALWLLIAVSAVNIALGVWRPRLPKIPF